MWYRVHLNRIHFNPLDKEGKIVRVLSSGPTFNVTTETNVEVELLYMLAEENSELMQFINAWTEQDNSWYQLIVTKLSDMSRAGFTGKLSVFSYKGYVLFQRIKGQLQFETKYMNIGELSAYNLQSRDVQEEVRNKSWHTIPDGEKVGQDWVEKNGGDQRADKRQYWHAD
tara:strand:+ start:2019 stop:2528 length:510 start_codon:yes stop_codon:yes gene_type:complete